MINSKKECSELLGIPVNSTKEEIKSAYKKLAKKYHPDLHMNKSKDEQRKYNEKFQELTHAYEIMMGKYDDTWAGGNVDILTFEDLLKSNAYGDYIDNIDDFEYTVTGETPSEIISNFKKEIRNEKRKNI